MGVIEDIINQIKHRQDQIDQLLITLQSDLDNVNATLDNVNKTLAQVQQILTGIQAMVNQVTQDYDSIKARVTALENKTIWDFILGHK